MEEILIPIVAIVALFIVFPGMIFHYITLWRKQRSLQPDDERMLEDLWRSARAMERRIESLESIIDVETERQARADTQRDDVYRKN